MGKDQELLEAARNGNVAVVEKILGQRAKRSGPLASLRRGPGANVQDSSGYSSLHHAALNGHKEIVKLLLEHDASTNIVDSKGSSPLHLAAWSGNVDIVRLLLCGPCICNVNLTTKDDETALHCAAQYGHTPVVSLLLEHGCDPGIRNSRGETALELAAQYGRLDTVELLVRTHPSLIQCMQRAIPGTVFPHTPLHLASRNGHKAVVEVLLRAGFDVNVLTKAGTALHEAALCGKVEVVRTLLEHGVDTSIRDSHGYTVMDLLRQFPAQATQEVMGILKKHRKMRASQGIDSDGESISHPFPILTNTDSDLGSPYENVRPTSKNSRPCATYPSPSTSPHRWDLQRMHRPPEAFDDRRVSRTSANSMESENSLYQIPCAPKAFMDSSVHSDDSHFLSAGKESDQISLSSTASSCGYPKRPESAGAPIYIPMNKGGHSPGSNSKVSPTPPKKPPRRNISISPTHLQPMSMSVDGVSNNAYEYLFLAHSGTRSQSNLNEIDHENRRERLAHGRSVDQYVEMNVFNIALDEEGERPTKELQRGKSEDLDCRKRQEPVAITSMYENTIIKQQNPRRKLRRNPDVYEEYDFHKKEETSSSAPETRFVSNAFIMIGGDDNDVKNGHENYVKKSVNLIQFPLSPTHYQQPPTPDHPPPTAIQAENLIHDRIRPLSQEYKRRSKDMETETEEEYLLIYDESSGSFSSSVSLSDRSVDNMVEEYHSDAPYAGLIKGSTRVLENITTNSQTPAERPKTLKKLKRVYDQSESSNDNHRSCNNSSGSERESDNKENKDRMSALSPFDEQEEWAKIQEIMASFGTGIVRESVFVSELEKEFQSRLMSLSFSQNSLNADASSVEKWLQGLEMGDYVGLFMANGFDDINFLNGVLEENDLKDMGITSELERQLILDATKELPYKVGEQFCNNNNNNNEQNDSVDNWLRRINLEQYSETFAKHLYHDMERIKRIWDVELSAVLDIDKIGHRKRILASVSSGEHITPGPKLEDINADLNFLRRFGQICAGHFQAVSIFEENTSVTLVLELSWLLKSHYYLPAHFKYQRHRDIFFEDADSLKMSSTDLDETSPEKVNDARFQKPKEKTTYKPMDRESLRSYLNNRKSKLLFIANANLEVLYLNKNNIQQLKSEMRSPSITDGNNTGTIRHRHKKSRPAPPPPVNAQKSVDLEKKCPSEISVGGNNSIKAQWRHQPILLITGVVKYTAIYLGSTLVKEFKGIESTKKSIQRVRKSVDRNEEDIILSISYRGVKFINPTAQNTICEHEIRNINCACQDTECLSYFAYITKDANNYYCHVFSTATPEQATEIILTLGQAFELAYQMALREQVTSKSRANRDNHKPAVSPGSVSSHSRDFKDSSTSRADLKLNGHPLKMKPLTLSLAAEPAVAEPQRTPTKANFSDIQG